MTRERPEDAAVLAELERLRLAVEFCRARRDETGEDFEAFVRAKMPPAREPLHTDGSDPRPAVPPAAAAPPVAAAPSSRSIFFETTAADFEVGDVEADEPPRSRRGWLAAAAVVLLLAGAAAFWMLRPAPDRPAVETTAAVPAPSAEPAAPATAPTPMPPPAPPSPVLTTTRAVWLRVVADGDRVLEREVPAGTRVPITAASTIVVRTGDAGAVQISLAGEEPASLGRDGQVVTRTFTLPAR